MITAIFLLFPLGQVLYHTHLMLHNVFVFLYHNKLLEMALVNIFFS